jgi:hypothetical protein
LENCRGYSGKDYVEDAEKGLDDVDRLVGLASEAVEGRAGGAEVGDRCAREVLVLELLGHGAYDCAEVLVVLVRGVSETREY